jgi:DNA polymerase I-like protein with 3'-5' exonuclease and polymerase domains
MEPCPYKLIVDPAEVAPAAQQLRNAPVMGLDTETTGLDPHTGRLRLIQLATPHETYIFDCFRLSPLQLQPILDLIASPQQVKILHNAKFDAKFLMRHCGIRPRNLFDTFLASRLISAGDESQRHGLEPVVNRFLGVNLDKTEQASDWSGELIVSQLEYAARDASVMLPLRDRIAARLDEMDLRRVAQLEFDCVLSVAAMELAGIYLDRERWNALLEGIAREHAKVTEELRQELSPGAAQMTLFGQPEPINLDSPAQVREALGRIGIEVEDTREWTLAKLARTHPVVEKLLEHRGLSRNLSSYGENILSFINPATGRIHAEFRQIGTPTGRLTATSPSLQQIPNTVEYRSCFRAPAGRKLIVADYSQIEMRVVADIAGDEALLSAFASGADLHRATAASVFGIPLEAITKQQREAAKGLNYGFVYGMGAEGLASRLEIPVPEAQGLIDRYFAAYPGIGRWLKQAADTAVRTRESRTLTGRLWKFQYDTGQRAQLAALKRVGKNAPIQGTASDIFKRAMTLLDEALLSYDAAIVNSIHDELVVECAEALCEEIKDIVVEKMIEGAKEFMLRVPIEVDAVIGDAWVKT